LNEIVQDSQFHFTVNKLQYNVMRYKEKDKTHEYKQTVCVFVTLCLYEVYLLYDVKCINLTLQY